MTTPTICFGSSSTSNTWLNSSKQACCRVPGLRDIEDSFCSFLKLVLYSLTEITPLVLWVPLYPGSASPANVLGSVWVFQKESIHRLTSPKAIPGLVALLWYSWPRSAIARDTPMGATYSETCRALSTVLFGKERAPKHELTQRCFSRDYRKQNGRTEAPAIYTPWVKFRL